MEQVKETLNNARELSVYLGYYNRYLEDLKKSFIQGKNVEYNSWGALHIFSHRTQTRKSPKCELVTTLSMFPIDRNVPLYRYGYKLIVILNCIEDERSPFDFVSNCFRLDELSDEKYEVSIEEKQRESGEWKFSTKIEHIDIPKMLTTFRAHDLFYDEISRNLLFFHKEIEKRK